MRLGLYLWILIILTLEVNAINFLVKNNFLELTIRMPLVFHFDSWFPCPFSFTLGDYWLFSTTHICLQIISQFLISKCLIICYIFQNNSIYFSVKDLSLSIRILHFLSLEQFCKFIYLFICQVHLDIAYFH